MTIVELTVPGHGQVHNGGAKTVREAIDSSAAAFAAVGIESPRLDAELLLAEATGLDRLSLVARSDQRLDPPAAVRWDEMVRRRLDREPVAYILGRKGFRHIDLAVDRRVLIPRPETELLVEVALELEPAMVLDVGTGSGAIALAIADELPDCDVIATDTSRAALEVARANAERLGLAERVTFVEGTIPDSIFDLIVANLPYVADRDRDSLQPEVTDHEPPEALFAGLDGLDAIRSLLSGPLPCDAIALEVGEGQATETASLVAAVGFGEVCVRRDLAGIDRAVLATRG